MIPGPDFVIMMQAERKKKSGEPLTEKEEAILKKYPRSAPKLCGCSPGCTKPLEPRVDGERPRIGGKEVNPDCYYAKFGEEIENFPIGGHGIRRRT